MPTLFGKSVAAVACLALLVAHWHATKALVPVAILPQPCCLRWQVCGKGSGLSPMAARVEEANAGLDIFRGLLAQGEREKIPPPKKGAQELMRLRLKILTSFFKLIVHVMLVLVLFFTFDLFFAPCLQSATWWVIGVLGYLLMFGLLSTKRPLASSLLVPLRLLLWVRLLLLVWVSGTDQSQSGVLGRHGLCQGSHILQTLLFPLGGMTILQTVSYFAVDTWVKGQIFGPNPNGLESFHSFLGPAGEQLLEATRKSGSRRKPKADHGSYCPLELAELQKDDSTKFARIRWSQGKQTEIQGRIGSEIGWDELLNTETGRAWAMDVPVAADFEKTAAAVACVAWVALLVVHWNVTKADVKSGLWQLLHFAEDWASGKGWSLSPMAARVEKELIEVRVKILMFFNRLCVHVVFIMIFLQLLEFLRAPSLHAATWLLQSVAAYLPHVLIIAAPGLFSSSLLRPMHLFFFVLVLTTAFVSGSDSKDEVFGRLGFCLSAQVVQAFIFPVGAVTVVQSISNAAAHTWVMGQAFGAVTLWLVLFHVCLNVLVSCALPLIFEFAVREWIVASFQSQDSDSLIAGFRQMLKGICDGELLLDGSFQICGTAPCLQRLLSSSENFAGRSFPDLLADDEARKLLNNFLAPAAATSDADEGAEGGKRLQSSAGAAPRCLRVPLRAPSGQAISVDVFHVPLPPSLYGESTAYHLQLGCTVSDVLQSDAVKCCGPDAECSLTCTGSRLGSFSFPTLAGKALPSSLLASRRPPSVRSAASNESYEECYDELAELTLLVNASTTLMDIEEAHLRFVRKTNKSKVRMGMPTLKRFARPLDWAGMDAVLRRYARKVRKAHAEGQQVEGEQEQALSSMTLRVPGESRKHLRSRRVTISSPFPRQHAAADVFLYVNLLGFEGPPARKTPSLSSLDEDVSMCDPAAPFELPTGPLGEGLPRPSNWLPELRRQPPSIGL
ncbi:unnamed protein product [Symbiodinium microadriaticum]|nr:unnamed protein product [Symbiodinium microadriaticum]